MKGRVFLLTLALYSLGQAQEILLKELEVRAKKTHFQDSLEIREVRESSAKDVGEAVQKLEGIWKIRKGGIANDPVLRGFYRDNINVLIDGVRIYGACPNRMDPPAFHVDFSEVKKIEVIKGPYDVRNQGSMAGLIEIITKEPEKGFHLQLNASAGSFNFINLSPVISYADDRFFGLAGYSYKYSKPYKDGDGKKFTEYTNYKPQFMNSKAFEINTYWIKMGFKPVEKHSLELSYTKQDARHVLYPYLMMDAIYDKTDRFNIGYRIDNISDTLKDLRFQFYYNKVDHWMDDRYRTSAGSNLWSMATDAQTKTYGGRLEASFGSLLVGLEAYKRNWDAVNYMGMDTQYIVPDVDVKNLGIYGEYRKSVTPKLRAVVGLRLDTTKTEADGSKANINLYKTYKNTTSTSKTDTYPSGNVQLFYTFSPQWELFLGVGHAVRVPDPQERYFALKRMNAPDWVGNPELKPSRNTQVDLGIRYNNGRIHSKLTLFYSYVQDYITLHKVVGPIKSAMSYTNVDAYFFGGELENRVALTDKIFFYGGLSYVQARKETDPSKNILSSRVAEIPPARVRLSLRYDTGMYFGEVETILSATQYRVDTDLKEQRTSGYGVVNVKVGGSYRGLTLTAGVDNLFDKKYYDYLSYLRNPFKAGVKVPEPGRTFYVSANYTF
ncbi:outer membrane insertion C-terminal signal [Thermocrinis albus DSM 14484]|uniref:Outer membrane insertion C-terminal signal n=1 Tax=Thermocrinis albus (strain DSM 14484 / JCM 11386 / HI 11/12) TaxID=638303 RepID=D3SNR9_THEAH|nr:TonB-dependent receptor [Thermocrinis albus]ADC88806.1 outer membrane insertion C-terminal signal [Thermocrinis albus DSM 14484]